MHKSIRNSLIVLLLPGLLLAQKWAARYDAGGNDAMTAMAVDAAGNVYVTGHSVGAGTGTDFMTIKYSPAGDTVWTRRAGGTGDDSAFALALDGSGNVYVTGCQESPTTGQDYLTIKYDPAGVANGPGPALVRGTAWTRPGRSRLTVRVMSMSQARAIPGQPARIS
jgi:hypothetical protein